ncbi:odorant receptor 13a-like [Cotesia glomerata]|uniref:odorant receptor 13a-like n=1 Tax=Cotesia glomerata TaxID=32391 RepID=UPI001D015A51|nr:odorant receptor 13a-like [Cotesia glomerata]
MPKILDMIHPLNESRPRIVLYYTEYFIRDEKYLAYIHIYEYIISPFPTIVVCAYDSLIVSSCQHACNMLYIVGYRFNNITATIEESNDKKCRTGSQILTKYITDHKAILRYIELYHDCFANTSLVVLILTVGTLCLAGIQCLLRMDEKAELIRFGLCTAAVFFHTFLLSICGQKFIDYSESLYTLTCQSQWYRLPVKLQKLMVIIMLEFAQPIHLKVGKIFTVSFESFTGIMQMTMSYFTVAHAVFL